MRPERTGLVRALHRNGERPPSDRLARDLIGPEGHAVDLTVLYGYLWRRGEVRGGDAWIEQELVTELAGREVPEPPPTSEVRLYLTERLDEYIALRDDDIRYWRKLSNEGGTWVWVRADLKLYRYRTRRDEARYLVGDIADAHLPGAASDPTGGVPGAPPPLPSSATCAWTHPCG